MSKKLVDTYEDILEDAAPELYEQSVDYRDGFLDGAYMLYAALENGARK